MLTKKQAAIAGNLLAHRILWNASQSGDFSQVFPEFYSAQGLGKTTPEDHELIRDVIGDIAANMIGKHIRFNSDLEIIAYAKTF